MFKRMLSVIMVCAVICTLFSGISVNSFAYEVDRVGNKMVSNDGKWEYFHSHKNDKEIVLVAYKGKETNIIVPESLDGKTVVGIGDVYYDSSTPTMKKLFADDLMVESIALPKTIKTINDWFRTEEKIDGMWVDGYFEDKCPIIPQDMEFIPSLSKSTITSITVDEDNPYFSSKDGILYNKKKTEILRFPAGKTVEEFKIPESVITIGTYAFLNTKVKKVDFNNVTNIEPYIFYNAQIEKVINADKVIEVSNGAFLRSKIKELPDFEIASSIGKYSFAYCDDLTKAKIPFSVNWIGDHAFYYCKNLKEVDFGKIISIGGAAFAQCRALKEADLPSTCKTLESYAFSNCRKLKKAELDSVETLGKRAFYKCYELEGDYVGTVNSQLSMYNIEEIGYKAFEKCTSLRSVHFGWDVELVSEKAFLDCTALEKIYFIVYPEEIHAQAFKNTAYVNNASEGIVYIDKLALCYKAPKKNQKTYIKIREGTTEIASWCLYKLDGIKSIYIPKSVKYIQEINLCECKQLKRVYMSNKNIVLNEFTCDNKNRSSAVYYVKPKAYYAIKHLEDDNCYFTTDWKPSKTKSVKAVGKTKTTAKITWKKQGYVTGYKVYMKTSKKGEWKKVATVKGSANTSYTMKGLSKNKTYYFRVRAYKTVYGETYHGAYSSSDAAKTKK